VSARPSPLRMRHAQRATSAPKELGSAREPRGHVGWSGILDAAGRARSWLVAVVVAFLMWGPVPTVALAGPSGVLRPNGGELSVGFRDNRLSLEAVEKPWQTLLGDLRRKTGIVLHVFPQPEGSVTASFRDLPVEQALRRLFGPDVHFVFLYEAAGPRSAFPTEVWVLAEGQPAPAEVTARAQGSSPPDSAPPAKEAKGKAASPAEEAHAARLNELRAVTDPAGLSSLLTALGDANPQVRQAAAEALGELGDESSVEALDRLLRGDADQEVRAIAASALARTESLRALAALARALKADDVATRRSAVAGIVQMTREETLPLLRAALRDQDGEVRRTAAEALEAR
jgi:hypothetical protein